MDTFTAVDEVHRLRDELAAAQYRLSQTERLACIGQNLREFSHEARNEVSVLQIGLEVLPRLLDDSREVAEFIVLLKERAHRLHRLLEDVRETAAPMGLNWDLWDVSEVWRKAWLSLLAQWKERDVSFEEDIGDMNIMLPLDAFRMEQVFRNLFQNSLEASTDPLVIHIRCFRQPDENEYISIAVRDNGPGLTREQRRKLFADSFTTKPRGSGLGLSIVKRIVEAHGGTIAVDENAFRGTEFLMNLRTTCDD